MAHNSVIRKSIAGTLLLFCLVMLSSGQISAQGNWYLLLYGKLTSKSDNSKLEGVKIIVKSNGSEFMELVADSSGSFEIKLPAEADYVVEFIYPAYVTKRIKFSTKMLPPEVIKEGPAYFPFDLAMFKEVEGIDYSVMKNHIAEIAYDAELGQFNYNKEYTASVKSDIDKLEEALDSKGMAEKEQEQMRDK